MLTTTYVITGGDDYGSGPFSVTFSAGMTSNSFDIPITDDTIFEGNETFTVTIVSSTLSTQVMEGVGCVVTVTIIDDDSKFGCTHQYCMLLNHLML